jgi:hypothetical protein
VANVAKPQSRVAQAALNNAQWCAAMCRAHGGRHHIADGLWFSDQPMPAQYPNVVTFSNGAQSKSHLAILRKLAGAGLPAGWTVKDSFAALDLKAQGFAALFDAQWIWRAPELALPDGAGLHWDRLRDEHELAAWQHARAEATAIPAALLDNADHTLLAGRRHGRIVAGCVVSAGARVAGLSNWFAAADEPAALGSAVAAIATLLPNAPIAGYERGGQLAPFAALGFEGIGPLRIWAKG